MKTLLLIRHAQAARDETVSDVSRPLAESGLADARRIGERLAHKRVAFDAFYSSPARRTLQTAEIIAECTGFARADVVSDDALYTFDRDRLLRAVASIAERRSTVAVCCHNFAVTGLVNLLTGASIDNVPTCGVAHVEIETEAWANVATAKATLVDFDYPNRE